MATYFEVTSAVFYIWVMTFMAQNYFITGSVLSPCRITGVGIYLEEKVNFSEASTACNQLNLQLASKEQVEKALKHGFETCSYGWVKDGLVVIPRITSNKKCGKGNVGLVLWRAEPFKTFQVYCFNSSVHSFIDECTDELVVGQHALKAADAIGTLISSVCMQYGVSVHETCHSASEMVGRLGSAKELANVHINSCKPDPATTILPSPSAPMDLTAYSGSDLTENITAVSNVTESEKSLKKIKYRVICVTETLLPTEGTTTETPEEYSLVGSPNYTSHTAFKNDAIVFGGIPTALLVLAVIFFIISVVLAVCYIKKYKKTFPFANKNQQKEMVETTALKEAKSNDKTPEKETKNNGNRIEESKTKPEATVKCLEAEV